jgi:putative ABC transport system ATP-binding protein
MALFLAIISNPQLLFLPPVRRKQTLMLKLVNLQKKYTTAAVETIALHQVSLDINQGEFVAIMGPSGCGKSSLLNLLGLLDNPSGGELYFLGEEVSHLSESRQADIRKGKIGFIFQHFNLLDELTVYENIELPLIYQHLSATEVKKRVETAMNQLQISHRRNNYPQQLSGGQQQRAAIARAVVNNPALILADEPTGNLDSATSHEVMRLLTQLNEAGATVVMVTHSLSHAEYSHRIIRLFDGEIFTESATKKSYVKELY